MSTTPQFDLFLDAPASTRQQEAESRTVALPAAARLDPRPNPVEIDYDALNASQDRKHSSVYEPVDAALARIRDTSAPSRSRIESWVTHPDERVPYALLVSRTVSPTSKNGRQISLTLLRRALEEARVADETWSPLLEALSAHGYWPSEWLASREGLPSEKEYQNTTVAPWLCALPAPETELSALVEGTRSRDLLLSVARHGEVMREPLVDKILARCPPAIRPLAERTPAEAEMDRYLLAAAVELSLVRIETHELAQKGDAYGHFVERAFDALQERGARLTNEQIDRLLAARRVVESKDGTRRVVVARVPFALLDAHIRRHGDEETALRYIRSAAERSDSHRITRLLEKTDWNPSNLEITPELARIAVEHGSNLPRVTSAVAGLADVRQDPRVRERLLQSRSLDVVRGLIADGRPEELPRLFRLLAPQDPELAAEVLARNRDVLAGGLTRSDLTPLLKSSVRAARLLAIQLLSEMPTTERAREDSARSR